MEIKFWGVRGSIPTPISTEQIKEKLIFLAQKKSHEKLSDNDKLRKFLEGLSPLDFGSIGGNTSCIEINTEDKNLIMDMGSGMKPLGKYIERHPEKYNHEFHIFLSHTHWDHISGLPFFQPAHNKKSHLKFYSPLEKLKLRLEYQQDHRFFPVGFELLKAKKSFYHLSRDTFKIDNCEITHLLQNHPGKSYAYKLSQENKSVIYMTDLFFESVTPEMESFCKNGDVLIFDSQFSAEEIAEKKDYGHCTGEKGVDLANAAGVKKLVLFHHDPDKTDLEIQENLQKVRVYNTTHYPAGNLEIALAYEGLKITL
ncbi:MAG: MBL fold metallo-hydrolase [Fidelibacterota bacterium]